LLYKSKILIRQVFPAFGKLKLQLWVTSLNGQDGKKVNVKI